jgi:hypothetical protein
MLVAITAALVPASSVLAASLVAVTSGPQDAPHDLSLISFATPAPPGSFQQPSQFALHDHVYLMSYLPDPDRAWVQFEFDAPVVVLGLNVVQHANGITRLQHAYGMAESSLAAGTVATSGLYGAATGQAQMIEFSVDPFAIIDSGAGTLHRFTISSTSLDNGWATYRFLLDVAPVPEPAAWWLLACGLGVLAALRASTARFHTTA